MKKIFFFVILSLLTISCGGNRSASVVDSWYDSPSGTTNKIKIISDLSPDDLKRECIDRLVRMRFDIDGGNGFNNIGNSLKTKYRYYENYYVRYFINFEGSVAIIRGEAGNIGLNGTGQEPAEHHVDWKTVTYEHRGWELMNSIAGINNAQKQYNR